MRDEERERKEIDLDVDDFVVDVAQKIRGERSNGQDELYVQPLQLGLILSRQVMTKIESVWASQSRTQQQQKKKTAELLQTYE